MSGVEHDADGNVIRPRFTTETERKLLELPCTDAGNAERLTIHFGDDLRYVPAWGWLVWDGKRWERSELKARESAIQTAKWIAQEAALLADEDQPHGQPKSRPRKVVV